MTLSIEDFCKKHDACSEGRDWALANCTDMQDAWQKLPQEYLIWVATRKGVLTEKELRLFACWCCRQIWHLLTDERSRNAVEVSERLANGEATQLELSAAEDAARAAAWGAARAAARAAALDAAWAAAWGAARAAARPAAGAAARAAARAAALDAAGAAARAAARAAAGDAAWAAAWAAAGDAARAAAWAAQAEYLRKHTTPNFEN